MDSIKLAQTIQDLVLLKSSRSPVISCYVNLEKPLRDSLLALEERARLIQNSFRGKAAADFADAFEEIRDHLLADPPSNARGMAIFSRWGDDPWFRAMPFQIPLETQLIADDIPIIYPLIEVKDRYQRFIIVITSAVEARILEMNVGAVTEALLAKRPDLRERAGREWSKEHFQSHLKERGDRFLAEKIQIIEKLISERGPTYIVLAGSPSYVARLRNALPTRLQTLVLNTVVADTKQGVSAVLRDSLQVFVEREQQDSLANVSRLEAAIRSNGLGVGGYHASRIALLNGQADLLLIQGDTNAPSEQEELVRIAVQQNVEIETVQESEALERFGGVGCLLRYHLPGTPVEERRQAA